MNVETNNVTVSLELLDVSKMKIDCRPPLSKRRNSRTGCIVENGENAPYLPIELSQSDDDRSKNTDSIKPLDSVENIKTNSMDRKFNTEEPKLAKEESHEVRNLRDMLLLHLDLIQQQQDLLVLKERQIAQYKEENATLKCRLERMERRMSLLKGSNVGGNSVSPSMSPIRPHSTNRIQAASLGKEESSGKGIKRKSSFEPQSLAKKFASIARKEYEKDKARGKIRNRHSDGGNFFVNKRRRKSALKRLSFPRRKTIQLGRRRSDTVSSGVSDKCKSTSHHNKRQNESESQVCGRSLRNRSLLSTSLNDGYDKRNSSSTITAASTPQKQTLLQVDSDISFLNTPSKKTECKSNKTKESQSGHCRRNNRGKEKVIKIPKDNSIMKTDVLYYTPVNYDPVDVISPKKPEKDDEVAVPTYRIKKFVPYYVIEGTENFDDEVYAKRHQKHEGEEKKRKRWDLQRQRELEQLEKLKQSNRQNEKEKDDDSEDDTFVPDPDKIKYIEVCDEIPVSVFGAPIPKVEAGEFNLPWFNIEKRDKQEAKKPKSKKR